MTMRLEYYEKDDNGIMPPKPSVTAEIPNGNWTVPTLKNFWSPLRIPLERVLSETVKIDVLPGSCDLFNALKEGVFIQPTKESQGTIYISEPNGIPFQLDNNRTVKVDAAKINGNVFIMDDAEIEFDAEYHQLRLKNVHKVV